jgi:hypothetical protein
MRAVQDGNRRKVLLPEGRPAKYHRLCIEIQEPYVPRTELLHEELELAVDRLAAAIRAIRGHAG